MDEWVLDFTYRVYQFPRNIVAFIRNFVKSMIAFLAYLRFFLWKHKIALIYWTLKRVNFYVKLNCYF